MTNTILKRQNGQPSGTLGNVVDNIFQNSLRRFFDDNFWEDDAKLTRGSIPVNIRETEQRYEMDVIAPGCQKDNFRINVEGNILTVSYAEKEENNEQNNKTGWVRNEYISRAFSRSFTLDDTLDVNNIEASYTDGVLRLLLAKNEKAKKISRVIDVK